MRRSILAILAILGLSLSGSMVSAGVNDFVITNYDIRYQLSRDEQGRSRLKTTETITAEFPSDDQNHGIERAIPKTYDGHSTSLDVVSVKKSDGSPWNYTKYSSNDNEVLRIGDADTYVHGSQTYVITYEQRDVTKAFADTGGDEFYWDTNGVDWRVPIRNLSVSLTIEESLASALNGKTACYRGQSGETGRCDVMGGSPYTVQASNLNPGENVTLAIGFHAATFKPYEPSLFERFVSLYLASLFIVGAIGVGIIVWLGILWGRWSNRKSELGTIVPEYIPPRDVSVTAAASIGAQTGPAFTAQLLDFAVRHYTKIYQTREKSLFKQAEYDIEIIRDIKTLKAEEQEIFSDIFSGKISVGTRLKLSSLRNNTKVFMAMQDNDPKLKKLVREEYGLRARDPAKTKTFSRAGWMLLVAAIVLLNPVLLIAAILAFVWAHTLWPLTDKGLELYRYMEGLKTYITVAEADRLAMLQSPEGAAKVGTVGADDTGVLVKLYERVLPYAVLFGQEKQWNKQLGLYYESAGTNPSWYSGSNAAFNAAMFSSAMGSFSTAASYTSASSSSSGGSSGGGSSGGGGGGGGGGGW